MFPFQLEIMTNIAGETSIGTILREFQVSWRKCMNASYGTFICTSTIILSLTARFKNMRAQLNSFVFHCHQSFWQTSQKTEESVWGLWLVDVGRLCLFLFFKVHCLSSLEIAMIVDKNTIVNEVLNFRVCLLLRSTVKMCTLKIEDWLQFENSRLHLKNWYMYIWSITNIHMSKKETGSIFCYA